MPSERRRAPRFPCTAEAEVFELRTDAHLEAGTSDLSLLGCYLEMLNPLPAGAEIKLHLTRLDTTFTAIGMVAYSESKIGMGVRFTVVEPDQEEVLGNWLADLSGKDS